MMQGGREIVREVILEPRLCQKGKYLRISFVVVGWDEKQKAFSAMT